MTAPSRHVLLLQGPASPFFARLGMALRARGAAVTRVTFCPGDSLYHRPAAGRLVPFRGRAGDWPGFLTRLVNRHRITDLVCLGDSRPRHREAIDTLRDTPIRLTVVEHGYIRPGWLTAEETGIGPNSPLPRDRAAILAASTGLPDRPDPAYPSSFAAYAALDVGYHLANLATAWALYPHYSRHALDHPLKEWAGWIGRGLKRGSVARHTARNLGCLTGRRHFLVPLQLETDFQIRHHGPPGGQIPQIRRLIASFAAHAPTDRLLVFKRHPLDNGWTPFVREIETAAAGYGVRDRCIYLETGPLERLFRGCDGVLCVNSTAGLDALRQGIPVWLSGSALYRIDGLTDNRPLDRFWLDAQPPEPALTDAFIRLLKHRALIPGAFDGPGAASGAAALAERLCAPPTGIDAQPLKEAA